MRWRRSMPRCSTSMKEVHFQGDLPAFLNFLRTDPQFYAEDAAGLAEACGVDRQGVRWQGLAILRLPAAATFRASCRCPPDLAPFYTGGRGGPGTYLVNTYDLPSRPLYSLPALTLHESAPGHAFQMPIATEHRDLPPFRRALHLRLRRRLGAVLRAAWRRDGHVSHAVRDVRHAELSGRGARRGWWSIRAFTRMGWTREQAHAVPARQHGAVRARDRDRGRPLHCVAGAGAVVLPGRDGDLEGAAQGGGGAGRQASTSARFTTRCWNWARCRCRCWISGSTNSLPMAAKGRIRRWSGRVTPPLPRVLRGYGQRWRRES